MNPAETLVKLLRERGETISLAESITGGALSKAITDCEGASHIFLGGVIAYSVESKLHDLDVPKAVIDEAGVYSEKTALAMAEGAKRRFGSDWSMATTGVAGPGESHGVPAGSVWIAIIGGETREVLPISLTGDRAAIRSGAVESALSAITRILRA